MRPIISALVLFAALSAAGLGMAACVLPVPDGGDGPPSPANLFGTIERVRLPYMLIRNSRTGARESVSLKGVAAIYTVYGGNGPLTALRRGLQVWVWFKQCTRPLKGIPQVDYVQVFSLAPGDRAALDGDGHIIAVPPLPLSSPQ